jgi:HEAT repeat protein
MRRDAARALGRFGTEGRDALPALVPLLRDRNAGVRKAAAGALRAIDPATAARLGA